MKTNANKTIATIAKDGLHTNTGISLKVEFIKAKLTRPNGRQLKAFVILKVTVIPIKNHTISININNALLGLCQHLDFN